jgi:hypothetical protein
VLCPTIAPQAGEQGEPPAVNVQFRPFAALSFRIDADTVTDAPPALAVVNLVDVMFTVILAVMKNEKKSVDDGLVTELTIISGPSAVPIGSVAGGVYTAVRPVATSLPQAGEQSDPPALRLHVTPALDGSWDIDAVTVTGADPNSTVLNLVEVMATSMECWIENEMESLACVSVTELTWMVGESAAPLGAVGGGV